jgi:hypothetical protein
MEFEGSSDIDHIHIGLVWAEHSDSALAFWPWLVLSIAEAVSEWAEEWDERFAGRYKRLDRPSCF